MKKLGHYNLVQTDAGWHSTLCAGNNKVISYDPREWDKSEYARIVFGHLQTMNNISVDRRKTTAGYFYFCLVHNASNDVVHMSETYNTKQSMERGIKSVLANAKTTDVRIVDRRTKK